MFGCGWVGDIGGVEKERGGREQANLNKQDGTGTEASPAKGKEGRIKYVRNRDNHGDGDELKQNKTQPPGSRTTETGARAGAGLTVLI